MSSGACAACCVIGGQYQHIFDGLVMENYGQDLTSNQGKNSLALLLLLLLRNWSRGVLPNFRVEVNQELERLLQLPACLNVCTPGEDEDSH